MKKLFAAIVYAMMLSCVNYPLTAEKDLYEMESVWQYLKVYSLWQDRVPTSAFEYDSPEIMLDKMKDTLKGFPYTTYDSYHLCGGACGTSAERKNSQANDTLYWSSVSDSTMYMQITAFENNTYQNFLSAISAMRQSYKNFRNLIIDLRQNGGGDIDVTDSIIWAILPANTPYLIETYRRYDKENRTAKTIEDETQVTKGGQHWALKNKRYALLVDSLSASASEMLIAALKVGFPQKASGDTDTVVVIGEKTYGKGIGQICITRQYHQRQDIKMTFMRMKGLGKIGDYHRTGIVPDIVSKDFKQQDSIALKLFEPKAHLNKQLARGSNTAISTHFPSEAVIVAPADDRPFK
jgi:C-terminal processing protease CtpA/Prc